MILRVTIVVLAIFGMDRCASAEWSYSGETGPDFWGLQYPTCSLTRQSPIGIRHDLAEADDNLTSFRFLGYDTVQQLQNLTVWNDGYTVTVRVHGNLKIDGGGLEGLYSLEHFHFHWGATDQEGSEHLLDGTAYPLEMHLVHKNQKHKQIAQALQDPQGLAVIGIFAKIGKPHPYFQTILENLKRLDIGDFASFRPFPLDKLFPDDTETYYRYAGSLTTPPCSQSVVWTVLQDPIEISEEQIEQIRALSVTSNITENFRPLQQLNGRQIFVRKKTQEEDDSPKIVPDDINRTNTTDSLDDPNSSNPIRSHVLAIIVISIITRMFI